MTIESEIAGLTQATTDLLAAVNVRKATLDTAVTTSTTNASTAVTKASEAASSAASALAIYGNTAAMNTAVSAASASQTAAATSATNASTSATQAAASAASASALVLGSASSLPSIAPSLNLDFANSKTLDPRITFGRASTGSYYDGKATVKAEENLLIRSQEFDNAAWVKSSVAVTANADVAPDGTTTADRVVATAGSYHSRYLSLTGVAPVPTSPTWYTLSFWVRSATGSNQNLTLEIIRQNAGYLNFAVTTTNEWQRFVYSIEIPVGGARIDAGISNSAAGDAFDVFVWGAQLEQRAYPTAYTPTTTSPITNYIPVLQTAASNASRIDHDPVTGECKGLLIEESRTNLLPYSENFNVGLGKEGASALDNVSIAPSGMMTATKLVESSANSDHRVYKNVTQPTAGTYTFSAYVKAAGRTKIQISEGFSVGGGCEFDLAAVTASLYAPGKNGSITPVGNGWFKVSVSWDFLANALTYVYMVLMSGTSASYQGDGYSGIYIWGAQLEAGAFATSYIPTNLTYSGRASTATYQGDDGFLATAAVNAPRYQRNAQGGQQLLLEGAGTNLLLASERFDAVWSKSALATVVPNTDVAPNGTLTADSILFSGADQTVAVMTASPIVGQTVTGSVYVKGTPGETIQIAVGGPDQAFTLDGTWQRLVATKTAAYNTFNINNFGGVTARSIKVWGAQLETGSVATSYMPSVDTFTSRSSTATYFDSTGVLRTAPANAPRYGYVYDASRAKWVSQGLLVEAAGTNLLLNSNTQTNVVNSTVTTNAVAPDGSTTANTVTAVAGGIVAYAGNYFGSFTAGTTYTFSLFVKRGAARYVNLTSNAANVSGGSAVFDLQLGTVAGTGATATSASIKFVGNDWYRLSVTGTSTTSGTQTLYIINYESGNIRLAASAGEIQLYSWGAQLEVGSVATSYIPTSGSQVTRAADVISSVAGSRATDVYSSSQVTRAADTASMTGTNFSSWYRADGGSFYAEFQQEAIALTDNAVFTVAGSPIWTNSAYHVRTYDTALVAASYNSGSLQDGAVSLGAVTINGSYKAAVGMATNNFGGASNNVLAATDTSVSVPQVTAFHIGHSGGANYRNGHIKKLSFYPKRLSNSELQALTA